MVVTSREYNRYADSNPVPLQVCTLTVSFGDYADPQQKSVKGKNKQRDSDVDSMGK